MSMEKDDLGRYVVELNESAAIIVEQIEDEITVSIASVVGVDFQQLLRRLIFPAPWPPPQRTLRRKRK
jgi:hypothetical protein